MLKLVKNTKELHFMTENTLDYFLDIVLNLRMTEHIIQKK